MKTDRQMEKEALAIYVAMARDDGAAIDMIHESTDRYVLDLLWRMLIAPAGPNTDSALNALFSTIVLRALNRLGGP